MKPFRVLSLDGGGMKSLYSLSVLKTLVKHFNGSTNKDFGKKFDLIVGTSAGSLIAAGLVCGKSLDEIEGFYHSLGSKIFTRSAPKSKRKLAMLLWGIFRTFWYAANENKKLRSSLEKIFQNETLEGIYNKRHIALCINATHMQSHEPKVFRTPHPPAYTKDNKRKLADICLASSAAPIFFPIALIPKPQSSTNKMEAYSDGGVWSCNPILVALVEALHLTKKDQSIEIVSVGTGPSAYKKTFTKKTANRGFLGWGLGSRVSELLINAQGKGSTFIAQLLAQQFSELGRSIKIIRAHNSWPDPKQVDHLGLDVSTEKAFSTWQNLGEETGTKMYQKSLEENSSDINLKEIFSD